MSTTNTVGPVLIMSELSEHIIKAIKQLNHSVRIEEYGSYVRVLVPERCRLTKQAVEAQSGMSFTLPESLESIMPSFKGNFSCSEDEVLWSLSKMEVANE